MENDRHETHDTTLSVEENKAPKLSPLKHDEDGGEIGDPTPMQPPLGYRKTPSLSEQIAQQVRIAHLKILEDQSVSETDDEADDFEVGDDYEPLSKYENDHVPTLAKLKARAKEINDQIREHNLKAAIELHKNNIKKPGSPAAQPPDNDLTLPKEPTE